MQLRNKKATKKKLKSYNAIIHKNMQIKTSVFKYQHSVHLLFNLMLSKPSIGLI